MDAKTITISTELFYCLCEADMAMKILKKNQKEYLYDKDRRITVLDAVLATCRVDEKEDEAC